MAEESRECPTCRVEQPLATNFGKNATCPGNGYQYECKRCRNARGREHTRETPLVDDAPLDAVRQCSLCGVEQPLRTNFTKRHGSYRRDCKPCANVRQRERRARNPEQREQEKRYRESIKESSRAYFADNYQRNRDKKLRHAAEWASNNRDRYRINMRAAFHRRQARLLGLPNEPYTIEQLIERDGTNCLLCKQPLDLTVGQRADLSVSVEHLVCVSWPNCPGDVLSNVALSHLRCNIVRGPRPHPNAAAKRAHLLAGSVDDSRGH